MLVGYENEYSWLILRDGDQSTGDQSTGDQSTGDQSTGDQSTGGKVSFDEKQQEYVNKLLADERRKAQKTAQNAIAELEALKSKTTLNAEQKAELENQITTLKNTLLTKEELSKQEKDRLKKEQQDAVNRLTAERDAWKNRYTNTAIESTILASASEHNAYNSAQLVDLLKPKTRLEFALAEDGTPTDRLEAKVDYTDRDKDGKPISLVLTVPEAISKMSNDPMWANLFKGKGSGGLGQSGGSATPANLAAAAKLDMGAFLAARKSGQLNY